MNILKYLFINEQTFELIIGGSFILSIALAITKMNLMYLMIGLPIFFVVMILIYYFFYITHILIDVLIINIKKHK